MSATTDPPVDDSEAPPAYCPSCGAPCRVEHSPNTEPLFICTGPDCGRTLRELEIPGGAA